MADESDWQAEFLDLILAVKIVEDMDEALNHIEQYGSNHTEAIVTNDYQRSQEFLDKVDASVVLVNASTRFNDGFELGLGAEIGISTSKVHANGPERIDKLKVHRVWIWTGKDVKVGILGGTFNPIHLGHLRAAEEIGEDLALNKVYLIPSGTPPHKSQTPIADFSHRLEMVKLASAFSPLLEAWDIEGIRGGFSYSIETLKSFHSFFGPGLELFFIIGTDAFLEIQTWKEYRNLFRYASFAVIQRPGHTTDRFTAFLDSLDVGFRWDSKGGCFRHPSGTVLFQKNITLMDISASTIRKKVAKGESIRFLVPEAVREYIEKTGIYRSHESTR